jgi:hypothetical protein
LLSGTQRANSVRRRVDQYHWYFAQYRSADPQELHLEIADDRIERFERDHERGHCGSVQCHVIGNTTGISTTGTGVNAGNCPLTGPTQVRLGNGSVINNTTAFLVNDPGTGTGTNKIAIWAWTTANTGSGLEVYMAGNATLVSGTGPSCTSACTSIGFWQSAFQPH